jgi:2-dehydropantoate 2-reductase
LANLASEGADLRICVVGAGSIGGHLAVLFATVGHNVTVVARGAHLAAIKEH